MKTVIEQYFYISVSYGDKATFALNTRSSKVQTSLSHELNHLYICYFQFVVAYLYLKIFRYKPTFYLLLLWFWAPRMVLKFIFCGLRSSSFKNIRYLLKEHSLQILTKTQDQFIILKISASLQDSSKETYKKSASKIKNVTLKMSKSLFNNVSNLL